jgi:Holliday junction resolvasome RuvABC endonuclease subunit
MMAKKKKNTWTEPTVPSYLDLTRKVRVLALDPGIRNFGLSVVEYCPVRQRSRILGTNMIANTIEEPKAWFSLQSKLYESEIRGLIKEFQPHLCIAERYQSRGQGGTTIECVGMMLNSLPHLMRYSDVKLVTAATWKNAFNRVHDLEQTYTKVEKPKTVHEFDATCMGLYRLSQVFDLLGFSFLDQKGLRRIIKRFNESPRI